MSTTAAASASLSASPTLSVMLGIHEKKTSALDLYRPLRNYISSHYSDREAQALEDDLQAVRQMRVDLDRPPDGQPPDARRDLLLSYYRALSAMEPRFPISPDRDHVSSLAFTWYDAFKPSKRASQHNIHLEKAAVLFNLGAIYSQMALAADRTTVDGLKQACNCFQSAAGAFAFLRDNASIKASVGSSATVDVSAECAGMLERLMLAQAQECFFEKVIGDGKPPGLCSKVASQISVYYEDAHVALNVPPLNQHFDKAWVSHVQLKAAQFKAEACYRAGLELHEKENIAEEIARLKAGLSVISDAKKSSKGVVAPLLETVAKLESNMNHNLERAMKENDRVYLMRVPASNSLPPIPAASLVKPVPMGEIFDSGKERLFTSLVPDSSAKALSRYTEMVDDIIRTQAEKMQQGSEMARVKLKEMDLPDSILAFEGSLSLPMDLKEDVEAVQVIGGPSGLESELQQLRDLRRVNQELLVQIEELLQKEEREDSQFRAQFGTRWNRPHSNTLTKSLQDRLNRFAANLKQAADSDARIDRAVKDHVALMAILDHRPIESVLPKLERPIMLLDTNEDAIVGTLKQSLRQLEGLGTQRAGLEDMLKDMKRKDDILPKLMATTGSYEDLFRKEISKYDHICEKIAENIEAQGKLLLQIQAQNDDFAAVFNLEDYKVSREKSYRQITAAITKFQEIKDNVNEGLKFYVTLQDAVTNMKQHCSDFVVARNAQCQEMIEDVQRKIGGLSFSDGKSGYNYPSAGLSNPSSSIPQQEDPGSSPKPLHSPESFNQPTAELIRPGNSQPRPPYALQQPPHHVSPPSGPYLSGQLSTGHEYGQPAYPGWRGPYPSTSSQQPPSSFPRPPYTIPGRYPPQQGSN